MRTKRSLLALTIGAVSLLTACGLPGGDPPPEEPEWPITVESTDSSAAVPLVVPAPYPAEVQATLTATTDVEDAYALSLTTTATSTIVCSISMGSTPTIKVYADGDDVSPAINALCSGDELEAVLGAGARITITNPNPPGSSQYSIYIIPA